MHQTQSADLPPSAYENRARELVAVVAACLFVATAIVCLRFYVRLVIIKKPGVDDWVLAAALVYFPHTYFIELPS